MDTCNQELTPAAVDTNDAALISEHQNLFWLNQGERVIRLMGKDKWHDALDTQIEELYIEDINKVMTGEVSVWEPITVTFIDLKSFKAVNDAKGHPEGDKVIQDITDLVDYVAGQLRIDEDNDLHDGSDVIAYRPNTAISGMQTGRVGGDEFNIFSETDEAGAKLIEERLRAAFAEYLALPENAHLVELGLNISIGSATLTPDMINPVELIDGESEEELDARIKHRARITSSMLTREADLAMYANKTAQVEAMLDEESKAEVQKFIKNMEDLGRSPRAISEYLSQIVTQSYIAERD